MRPVVWGLALGIACLVLLAGCWAYAGQYEPDPAPVDQPGIELDVDGPKMQKPAPKAGKR